MVVMYKLLTPVSKPVEILHSGCEMNLFFTCLKKATSCVLFAYPAQQAPTVF